MGSSHCDFGSSTGILHSHAGYDKTYCGAADLAAKHLKTIEVYWR
jgi:hypothetical protein